MESLIPTAQEYGIIGLVLLACFYFIFQMMKNFQTQNKETFDRLESMHENALKAITNNTIVLSEIKTIIDNK